MGGIYGGKDIRPISQKQDSLHGLINTILDKLPLGVFVKDAEDGFRYLYWNRFMEEITGIGTEEVEGHNDFELSFDAIMPAEERLGWIVMSWRRVGLLNLAGRFLMRMASRRISKSRNSRLP